MNHNLIKLAATTAIAFTCIGGSALAQSDPTPWSGFYVGASGGVAESDTKAQATLTTSTGSVLTPADAAAINTLSQSTHSKTGFAGGIEGGYNYMMGSLMLGIEADWSILDLKDESAKTYQSPLLITPPVIYSLGQEIKTDWLVTVRPRIGYSFGSVLVFGSAGLAFSELKYKAAFFDNRSTPNRVETSSSTTKTGFAGSFGAAYAFTPQLSLKGEYMFTDFGHVGSAYTNNLATVTPTDKVKSHIIRAGIDYRF